MKLVDTHCHLYMPDLREDLDGVIARAGLAGVKRIIVPGIDIESSRKAVDLAAEYENVFASVGIHPHNADTVTKQDLMELRDLVTKNDKVVAIGEIGLDNYRKHSDPQKQKDVFRDLLDLAAELDLPVIVHSREASGDIVEMLGRAKPNFLKGVMHCFSGGEDFLEKVLSFGLYVSFAGNITFPKASDLRESARLAGIEKILLETDAPYMAPAKYRGKRNEPSFIVSLAEFYGEIFGISQDKVGCITSANADGLFRLALEGTGTIVYKIKNSLYVNMTHRCSNRCGFCARQVSDKVKGHDLHLGCDPAREDIISAIGDPSGYDEVVFCGFGEPTLRWGALKRVASYVKERGGQVRLNTNGEASLINGRDVTPEMEGIVDRVSVSLNAPDSRMYDKLCASAFGEKAHGGIIDFISGCSSRGIKTEITCIDSIGEEAVRACRKIGDSLNAGFRLRYLDEVG